MAKHKYRITVEYIADNHGNPVEAAPLVFETQNHDDVLALMAKRAHDDDERSFLLGVKLFGETLLENREEPLYRDISAHFGTFMKAFKSAKKAEAPRAAVIAETTPIAKD